MHPSSGREDDAGLKLRCCLVTTCREHRKAGAGARRVASRRQMGASQLARGSAALNVDPSCAAAVALRAGPSGRSSREVWLLCSSLQLMSCSSQAALERSKSIGTTQTCSARAEEDLTLHPRYCGRKNQRHNNSFIYESIPIWIYLSYNFHDVLGLCHVVYLKYIFGFWHIWSWVRCGAWLRIRISLTLSLVVGRNPRLGFVFKLNNTRILQAVLVRARLYLVATWAAEALNKVSNACSTFTNMVKSLVKKKKIRLFFWNLTRI